MEIKENFVRAILAAEFPENFQEIYDSSPLLQYLDMKMGAVNGSSKTRRSYGNIYAIYSLLYFYQNDYYNNPEGYRNFEGYEYTKLFNFFRGLYGGSKLQNHALNSRVNGEFRNKIQGTGNDPIIINESKYFLHIDYLYAQDIDISKLAIKIIEKYIELIMEKDSALLSLLKGMTALTDYKAKRGQITSLLTEDAEARVFEIISYAILKNHYKNITVYFGYSQDDLKESQLKLYKTGRTNANDGGIDFVMRPLGRFFQVTEVNTYDKYLLDIDKVMHFPISFVIKTNKTKESISEELNDYISQRASGMLVIQRRYKDAIEEIITINELKKWISELDNASIDGIIRDIDTYYRLEMNVDTETEDDEEE